MKNNKSRQGVISSGRRNFILAACFFCIFAAVSVFRCSISYGLESAYSAPAVTPVPEIPFFASLYVREEFDNNIFLTRSDRVYDFKTTVVPTLGVIYKTTWLDLKLSDSFFFWHYARQDTSYYSNEANLVAKLTAIRNFLYVDLTDVYSNMILDPRGPSTDANRNINRTDANAGNVSPYIKYDISAASSVIAGGAYTNIWYRQDGVNRQQYKGFLIIERRFSPTFGALLGGEYLADRPQGDVEPSNNQTAAFASMSTSLTPHTRFGATGGYRWVRFSDNRDYNRPIYNVGLVHDFPAQGKIELRAKSEFGTTPLFGVVRTERQEAVIEYFISPTVASMKAGVFHKQDKYAELIRTDEALGVSAGFDYNPFPRLRFQVSGIYEKDRYSPQATRREAYNVSTGLDYKITPKITFGLTYSYNKSRGGFETDNYFDNLAGVQVKAEL